MADDFYIRKIQNKYTGFLEPVYVPINDHIYVIINDVSDVRILKTDLNLQYVWGQTFNFADDRIAQGLPTFFELNDAVETSDGDLIFCGHTGDSYLTEHGVLLKLTSNGELVWFKENQPAPSHNSTVFIQIANLGNNRLAIYDSQGLSEFPVHNKPGDIDSRESLYFLTIDNDGNILDHFIPSFSFDFFRGTLITTDSLVICVDNIGFRGFIELCVYNADTKLGETVSVSIPDISSQQLSVSEVKAQIKEGKLYINAIDQATNNLLSIVVDINNISSITTADSYPIIPVSENVAQVYTSIINDGVLYAFYNNTNTSTIVYKFEPVKGLIWKKEVPKNIKDVIATDEFILAPFVNTLGDDGYALGKMNLDFQAGSCLDITNLSSFVTSSKITLTTTKRDISSTPSSNEYDFVNTLLNTEEITDYEVDDICVVSSFVNLSNSIIYASFTTINAGGNSQSTITVQLRDDSRVNITKGGENVVITTSTGTITGTTDNNDGTYTAALTSGMVSETAILNFTINEELARSTTSVFFRPVLDLTKSTIVAYDPNIDADGESTSFIKVTLFDTEGNQYSDFERIVITTTAGTILPSFDEYDGTYSAILRSSTVEETAIVGFTINGDQAPITTNVVFTNLRPVLDPTKSTIVATHTNIDADGESTSFITVTLFDTEGNQYSDFERIAITTTAGEIGTTNDEYDGTYTAILTSSTAGETAVVGFTVNGNQAPTTTNVVFEPVIVQVTCPAHIAFLIDESGSINNQTTNEIDEIQEGLRSFIELQEGSNLTISLIGMSDSDTDTRNDHVLEKLVTSSTKGEFNTWITNFRNGRASSLSHHWSSGLEVVENLSKIPDIIIIVADGAQATSPSILLDAIKKANNKSHLFVYALDNGLYSNGLNFSRRAIEDTLSYYWNRSPIPSTSNNDILITDYVRGISEFQQLGNALKGLNDSLIEAEVGCGNIEITGTSFDEIVLFSRQEVVGLEIGSISLQNDKGSPHIIEAGTQLISTNGLIVTAIAQVIIQSGDEGIVPVVLVGTPFKNGEFEEIISVAGVLNPNELTISILVKPQEKIKYTQSPFLYLQAAGSTGEDGSAEGVHLRWIYKNALGDNHLPKGNLAANAIGFNKPNDYAKICRVPYVKEQITIDFNELPTLEFSRRKFNYFFLNQRPFWVYEVEGNRYEIYFSNVLKYNSTANSIDPETNPIEFLKSYGDNIIEIVTKYSLAFSAEFIVENSLPSSTLQTELIGSEEKLLSDKKQGIVARKTFSSNQFGNTFQQAEDIQTIRFRANDCLVTGLKVELYSTIVEKANKEELWEELGDYALTTDDKIALNNLEPSAGLIDGKWPRFNEGSAVKLDNYRNKWNNDKTGIAEKDLKQLVTDYIKLSNDQDNPTGKELISFSDDDSDAKEIPYLDILQIASADYHIARMLGLGCFDLSGDTKSQKYVYAIKYTTKNEIDNYVYDEEGFEVEHIYTSLPTSNLDERLPLSFDIEKIIPGVVSGDYLTEELNEDNTVAGVTPNISLIDSNGYGSSGKSRYISIFVADETDDELLQSFYTKTNQFNSSEYTYPVYGGIEKKVEELDGNNAWKPGDTPWDKPEVSISDEYFNSDNTPEIIPLSVPEKGNPIYVHKHIEDGIYYYGVYGINWFSRVSPVTKALNTVTELVPDNNLLPPYNINALHIVEERPLLLTSASEQNLLRAIPETKKDNTLVRLAFDYNTKQELVSYKITDRNRIEAAEKLKDVVNTGDNVLLHSDAIYKDEKEIFADEVELFFRNELPKNIRGKIKQISDHPTDKKISIITTERYRVNSSNEVEYLEPEFPEGTTSVNFEGGVFTTNGNNFFIESIAENNSTVVISVYKNDTDNNVQTSIVPVDEDKLEAPTIQDDAFFMAIENMQADKTWGTVTNPNSSFKVNLNLGDYTKIHREIIINAEGPDDGEEEILEKSRGFWGESKITIVEQVVDRVNEVDVLGHKGLYKIEMPFKLGRHSQNTPDALGNFVEWSGGIVRVHLEEDQKGPRKSLNVIRIENVGSTTENVIVYASDESFESLNNETILIGDKIEVNFYPGYKVYLYADSRFNLTKDSIIPLDEEQVKYSIFGLRVRDNEAEKRFNRKYASTISAPSMMFVHKIIDPLQPEKPLGSLYATQPDSFGKVTYTLTTAFKHRPYGVLYYRSNDRSILGALYTHSTAAKIMDKLESYNPDIFYVNRWNDLLSFQYAEEFSEWPKTVDSYRFPKPDKQAFFNLMNGDIAEYNEKYRQSRIKIDPNNFDLNTIVIPAVGKEFPVKTVGDYVRIAIMNSFVSLTEAPLLYDYMEPESYQPTNKRQVVRDRNGNLMKPGAQGYDIAPMAKRLNVSGKSNDIIFTDFKLDGTSKNTYFYTSREVGSTTQLGAFSEIAGPIKLVNTKEPENPEIKRVLPILASNEFAFVQVPLEFVDVENIQILEGDALRKISDSSQNAGLASKQILRGNTYVTFKAETGIEAKIGFSSFNTNSNGESIQFALSINLNNTLHVFENGEDLGAVGSFTADSIFRIEIKGNTIIFSRDEVILKTIELLRASEFILDIALDSANASIYDIKLFSIAPTYTQEELVGENIPLTFTSVENIEINDSIISKNAGLNGDVWDAGAYTVEYLPYYGSISYKVKDNSRVIVGLASDSRNSSENIQYALLTDENGYLSVYKNGESIQKCVQYTRESLLEIERRNNYLVFKKDHRPFYELLLENNIPLFVDFSMYDGDAEIIDLQMKATRELVKNIDSNEINPALSFEVNAYQPDQRIRKLNLYRTTKPENSLSVRTMDYVNSIDLVLTDQLNSNILTIKDEFLDMDFVPYSEPLYYRVTVSREVEYAKPNTEPAVIVSEYKPSKSSKLLISSIVESTSPKAPDLVYGFDALANNDTVIENIILKWNKTVHNGKYHIYNMNSQGNWVKIHEIISNDEEVQLLLEETDLENALQIEDTEGTSKYYHFKVDAENSVGMLNVKSKIVTIPGESGVASLEGIGSMIIENTNLVR